MEGHSWQNLLLNDWSHQHPPRADGTSSGSGLGAVSNWIRKLFYRNHCTNQEWALAEIPRKSTSPSWTVHTDMERGFVLPQSSPSVSSLNIRQGKKKKHVLHNITEYFCLPHLTKLNQYKKQYKQTYLSWRTLVGKSMGNYILPKEFLQLSKIPRGWKYTRDLSEHCEFQKKVQNISFK